MFAASVCCVWRGCWHSLTYLLNRFVVLGVFVGINWHWRVCCISLLCLAWLLAFIDVFVVSICGVWRGCWHSLACLLHQFVVFGVVVGINGRIFASVCCAWRGC